MRFANNVIDGYAEPFRIWSQGVSGLRIANNLILKPAVALTLESADAANLFDYNVFGGELSLRANVGGVSVEAAAWMKVQMPHSRVLRGLELGGGDLAKVVGFSPVDAGTPIEGVAFRGAAPDIGVARALKPGRMTLPRPVSVIVLRLDFMCSPGWSPAP